MEIKEFQIPVPWGHIAVKTYGREEDTPVLSLHGAQDNSGTFDRLIPLLPSSFYYICVDLPGQGRSSAFPLYTFLTDIDYISAIKFITDYLQFKKYICLGHSRGGQYFVHFAQLYPHLVDKLIVLDSTYLLLDELDTYRDKLLYDIEYMSKITNNVIKKNIPEYTYEEATLKVIESRTYSKLDRKCAEIMLNRMIIPVSNGKYQLSTDPRLRVTKKIGFDMEFALKLLSKYPIVCPCLFIIASESLPYHIEFQYESVIDTIKKHSDKRCDVEIVSGDHDVHLMKPELVAPIITNFLTFTNSKL